MRWILLGVLALQLTFGVHIGGAQSVGPTRVEIGGVKLAAIRFPSEPSPKRSKDAVRGLTMPAPVARGAVAARPRFGSVMTNDAPDTVRLMSPSDLQSLPSRKPDRISAYGSDSSQFGELRVPAGPGPHPVVVLVHGGCFKAAYATRRDLAPMGDALKAAGIATWNIEYRRLGQPGGGWPGTHTDVGKAVDHLRTLAREYSLDLGRVAIVGHSAGGHLALWAAARTRIPPGSALFVANPLPLSGVLDLAGPVDLTANIDGYEGLCLDAVITNLLGGRPTAVPERYAQVSSQRLLPLGIPQVVLIGEHEEFVPLPIAQRYVSAATAAGDRARLIVIPRVGHFEIASPLASPWPRVLRTIRALVDGAFPPP